MSRQVYRVWMMLRDARHGTRSHFEVGLPDQSTRSQRSDSEVVMEDLATTISDLNRATKRVISRVAGKTAN